MTNPTMEQWAIFDKADAMREAVAQLCREYAAEGASYLALDIDSLFDGLSDESAARLYDILRA